MSDTGRLRDDERRDADIVVVGGGIVGAHLGIWLDKKGKDVRVYERKPRKDVVCTGLVSRETLYLSTFLRKAVIQKVHGAMIEYKGEEVVVERKGVAVVLDRTGLERILHDVLEERGILVKGVWKEGGEVVIGADGANSSVRKLVTSRKVNTYIGAYTYIGGEGDYVRVILEREGFLWEVPRGSVTEVGFFSPRRLREYYEKRIRKRWRVSVDRYRVIPVDKPLWRVRRRRVFLVGDAAVHTKATTGGGIHYGLLAARELVRDMEGYESFHRKVIYPRLLTHYLIRRLYNAVGPSPFFRLLEVFRDSVEKRGSMDDPFSFFMPQTYVLYERTPRI